MRIHPLQRKKRRRTWQLVAIGLVASIILSIGIQAASRPQAKLDQTSRNEVVIPKKSVEVGTPPMPVKDPIDTFLDQLAAAPGIMKAPLAFSIAPPKKGSRIVITLKHGNTSAVLAKEAWMGDPAGQRGTVANVYLKADRFPIISKIDKSYELSYLVVDSPSENDPAIEELKDVVEFNTVFKLSTPPGLSLSDHQSQTEHDSERMDGYAWLPDRKLRLRLKADGTIVLVNPDGKGDVLLRELGQ